MTCTCRASRVETVHAVAEMPEHLVWTWGGLTVLASEWQGGKSGCPRNAWCPRCGSPLGFDSAGLPTVGASYAELERDAAITRGFRQLARLRTFWQRVMTGEPLTADDRAAMTDLNQYIADALPAETEEEWHDHRK